jgi:hypothetical protein
MGVLGATIIMIELVAARTANLIGRPVSRSGFPELYRRARSQGALCKGREETNASWFSIQFLGHWMARVAGVRLVAVMREERTPCASSRAVPIPLRDRVQVEGALRQSHDEGLHSGESAEAVPRVYLAAHGVTHLLAHVKNILEDGRRGLA